MKRILCILLSCLLCLGTQGKRVRVSCIGNSITYGTGLEHPEREGYPAQLQRLLGEEYEVRQFGRPSATLLNQGPLPYMLQREFKDALAYGADIAIVHLGVNDTDEQAWPLHRGEFVSDYSALIDSLRKVNPKCRVMVARITPLTPKHRRYDKGVKEWHQEIRDSIDRVAKKNGCELIDFYSPLAQRMELLPDAIHPNAEGHTIMAKAAYEVIRNCPLTCATMNIRYDNKDDRKKGLGWDERKTRVADYVRENMPDIIGMQEVLHHQAEDLKRMLPEYTLIGVGREDGKKKGEYAALWYKTSLFELIESGHFWLSETPDVAGSMGWDAACTRMATWARLRNRRNGKTLLLLNTHMDHVGQTARRKGAELILQRLKKIVHEGESVVVTGDLNVSERDDAYQQLTNDTQLPLADTFKQTSHHYGVDYTWHGFNRVPEGEREKIDFILTSRNIDVLSTTILPVDKEKMASDHCFLIATLRPQ